MSIHKYELRAKAVQSMLCIGLDSAFEKLPERFHREDFPQFAFNLWLIEQTHPYVSAYKPNMAFYEARGDQGWRELHMTMDYLHEQHPDIYTICDAKRADIDSTNAGYVTAVFDRLGFDAVTLHPYLGREALEPFLERGDCIILCRTSNPGAGELQDLSVGGKPLWQVVAERVHDEWNTRGNCMLVVGATYPDELRQVRAIVGEMTLLVPGVGAQGGTVEDVIRVGRNTAGLGLIISASRSVIFADNPAEEARRLQAEMQRIAPK
ncbi:MAG: orotidine-5'-phosphate decarboxylase [Burkholderiales bacterium]|nr:orotidine-5'-phosphate decarboxylase [Anaerolineae bacterium]